MIKFTTNLGSFTLELNAEKAPKTVANFIDYVESGHYNGTIFHRVIDGFTGSRRWIFSGNEAKICRWTGVINEAANGLKNDRYTVAMARTSDPHSATAQFFINVGDNDFLNHPGQDGWGYCVFGRVVDGTDVVDKITAVKTASSGYHTKNVPQDRRHY